MRAAGLGPIRRAGSRGRPAPPSGRASGQPARRCRASTRCQRSRWMCRVRSATRSSRWSTSRRSSRSGPSSVATGRSGFASAARATARASIGSLLPGSRTERRAPAISLGGTRTTGLARPEQVGLQATGQVPAVLERPASVGPPGRPAPAARGARRGVAGIVFSAELATRLVDRHDRVPALVQIRAEDHHVHRLLLIIEVTEDRSADTPESGRSHAPIKSRRPVCRVSRPAQPHGSHARGWASSLRAKPDDATERDTQRS